MMNINEAVKEYLDNGNIISPGIASILSQSGERQTLYKILLDHSLLPFRTLLHFALDLEVAFRNELFNGERQDPDEHYEGIYRCAFLLYRAGDAADTLRLWPAKHINMDVGTALGAEYFLGAGLAATFAYLGGRSDPDAVLIVKYLKQFLSYEAGKWSCREGWEFDRMRNIREA